MGTENVNITENRRAVQVKYECKTYGSGQRTVTVAARRDGQDVIAYVENVVVAAVARDHSVKSPLCGAREISNLMIPVDDSGVVGREGKKIVH